MTDVPSNPSGPGRAACWQRCGIWEGRPRSGAREELVQGIERDLLPVVRHAPGVRRAHALWVKRHEDRDAGMFCQIVVEFDSAQAMDRLLASPEREPIRAALLPLLSLFEGTISHVCGEVLSPV